MIKILLIALIFMLGASFGSFLSFVIHRIKSNKKGIIFGHSNCPKCKKQLTSLDLIPIFSYIFLKGKCRKCKKQIPANYIFLEFITGLVFVSIFSKFQFVSIKEVEIITPLYEMLIPFIFYCAYSAFFVGIFFYDLQTNKIPDAFLFPLLVISIIGSLIMGTPTITSMIIAALIALLFFGGQILVSKGRWLGEGDLILSLSMAAIFGWQLFLVSVVISYFTGTLISIPLLLTKKTAIKSKIPFGPFLVMGSFITIFFGQEILDFYLKTLMI